MAGCVLFLCETLRVWVLYKSHLHLCRRLFELNEGDLENLPIYVDSPLQILEESHIEFNLHRWVVYMLWIQKSGKPFYWFQQIVKKYPIPSLGQLQELVWFLERKDNKSLQPKLSLSDIGIPLSPVV